MNTRVGPSRERDACLLSCQLVQSRLNLALDSARVGLELRSG